MIVSFEIEQAEDLDLLLQITRRLKIKQVKTPLSTPVILEKNLSEGNEINIKEINDDIASIFGDDTNDSLPFGL